MEFATEFRRRFLIIQTETPTPTDFPNPKMIRCVQKKYEKNVLVFVYRIVTIQIVINRVIILTFTSRMKSSIVVL